MKFKILVLVFVKEEVFFTWIVWPDIFYSFVNIPLVFDFVKVNSSFVAGHGASSNFDASSNVQYIVKMFKYVIKLCTYKNSRKGKDFSL